MVKVTKAGVARGIGAAYLTLKYYDEMQDNYAKGNWLEAAKDTGFFAVAITPVVAPNFFFGTLAPVWIGAGIGVVTTAVIVEATGIGTTQDVIDMIVDPPVDDWYEVVIPAIDKRTDELSKRAAHWVDRRLMEGQHFIEGIPSEIGKHYSWLNRQMPRLPF